MFSYMPAKIIMLLIFLGIFICLYFGLTITIKLTNNSAEKKNAKYIALSTIAVVFCVFTLLVILPLYTPIGELTTKMYYEDPFESDFNNEPHTSSYEIFYDNIFIYDGEMYTNARDKYQDYRVSTIKNQEKPDDLEVINLIEIFKIEEEEFITTKRGKRQNGNTAYYHTLPILTEDKHAFNMTKGQSILKFEKTPKTNEFCMFYDGMYYTILDNSKDVFEDFTFDQNTYITVDDVNDFTFYKNIMPNAYKAYFIAQSIDIYVNIIVGIFSLLCIFFSVKTLLKIDNIENLNKPNLKSRYYRILKTLMYFLLIFSYCATYVMRIESEYIKDSLTIYYDESDNTNYKSTSYKDYNNSIQGIDDNTNFKENYYKKMIYHNNNIYSENIDMFFLLFSQEKIELNEPITSQNFDRNKTYQLKDKKQINGIDITEIKGEKILVFEKSLHPTEELFIKVGEPKEVELKKYTGQIEKAILYPHTLPVLEEEGQSFNISTNKYLYTTDFNVNRDDGYFFVLYNDCLFEMTNDLLWKFDEISKTPEAYFVETVTEEVITRTTYAYKEVPISESLKSYGVQPIKTLDTDNPIAYDEIIYTYNINPLIIENPSYLDEYYNGDDYALNFEHIVYLSWSGFVIVSILMLISFRKKRPNK